MITDEILGGEYDQILDDIVQAIEDRRDIMGKRLVQELQVGDRVRFNDHVSPKYLTGVPATVSSKRGGKVMVTLDRSVRRYSAGVPIDVVPSILERA